MITWGSVVETNSEMTVPSNFQIRSHHTNLIFRLRIVVRFRISGQEGFLECERSQSRCNLVIYSALIVSKEDKATKGYSLSQYSHV